MYIIQSIGLFLGKERPIDWSTSIRFLLLRPFWITQIHSLGKEIKRYGRAVACPCEMNVHLSHHLSQANYWELSAVIVENNRRQFPIIGLGQA